MNKSCKNEKPLKKEITRRVVVYTLADGVQPAWAVHLYCPSMVDVLFLIKYILRLAWDSQLVKQTITTTLASVMVCVLITEKFLIMSKWENISL